MSKNEEWGLTSQSFDNVCFPYRVGALVGTEDTGNL